MAQVDFVFPELETAGQYLRVLTLNDALEVLKHFADPDVTQYMDIEALEDIDAARELINYHAQDSGCRWGIFDKADGALIGTCGFHCWIDGQEAEIGYDLAKRYWGGGIMSEVLATVIEFGFDRMGLRRILAELEPANQRSIGLLQKLGFKTESQSNDMLIYSLERDSSDHRVET